MKKLLSLLGLLLVITVLLASSCASPTTGGETGKGPITVGSKIDTEGSLLSQMIILMLRDRGFKVNDKSQFGPTPVVRKAITSAELDLYPEYTGNGAFFFNEADSDVWKDAQKGYDRVKKLDKEANDIVWLTPAPANNTWAIAITKTLAQKENLKTLGDFAAYAKRGGQIKLIGSEEFVNSPAALPAFQKAYGFTLQENQLLTVSSGDTAQTEKAASEGTGGVNAAMAYGTDGSLSAFGLVVLEDPKGVQPVYEPAPIIRGQVFSRYPEIETILGPVFRTLDLETLQTLNAKIAIQGQNPADVAGQYLKAKGFLK
ncbi:MAG: ABC transporter substrate-binding protein [Chloroflexi bacterium]|nr:ABC transporter substrate-binding protein [Chloroflexota bacterium]